MDTVVTSDDDCELIIKVNKGIHNNYEGIKLQHNFQIRLEGMTFNTTPAQFDTKSQFGLVSTKYKSDDTVTKFIICGISDRCTIRTTTYNKL